VNLPVQGTGFHIEARNPAILVNPATGPLANLLGTDVASRLAAASRRAEALLLSHLNNEQKLSWAEHGYFNVRGGQSGDLYWITHRDKWPRVGTWGVGRYEVKPIGLDRGPVVTAYCIYGYSSTKVAGYQITEGLPYYDQIFLKKILVELDEDRLQKVGVVGAFWPGDTPVYHTDPVRWDPANNPRHRMEVVTRDAVVDVAPTEPDPN
jgi:hypothetical protein